VASDRGRSHYVKLLLQAGVNVNAATAGGTTALHLAARTVWDHEGDTVRVLLEHGANANVKTKDGRTPLGEAIGGYSRHCVTEMLMEHGADVNTLTVRRNRSRDRSDSDSESSDDSKACEGEETPLHLAIAKKKNAVALLLLSNGADTNVINVKGQTPLVKAQELGLEGVIARLSEPKSLDSRASLLACQRWAYVPNERK
jgi:ankyrin repeat protein